MSSIPNLIFFSRNSNIFFIKPESVEFSKTTISNIKHNFWTWFLGFLLVTINDDEEIGPLPGFTNLQLVDPVKARLIMAAESKSLDDLVRNLRENNNILHQFCLERGLDYGTQNTANAIDVYFSNFSVHDEFNDDDD
uniref:Uncharacterized protein n=1 Tax=Meloidogyne incognita TaxID=6306 RepID=A0A914L6H4_MELIC